MEIGGGTKCAVAGFWCGPARMWLDADTGGGTTGWFREPSAALRSRSISSAPR